MPPMRPAGAEPYPRDWEAVLRERADGAIATLSRVPGVCGLVLGGSLGSGEPWPLSDIDILPIYEDTSSTEAQEEVARGWVELTARWEEEGWQTGLDVGVLAFTRRDVLDAIQLSPSESLHLLADSRWYHSLDKGLGGRAAYDPDGLAAALVGWFAATRFSPAVVAARLARQRRNIDEAYGALLASIANGDPLAGTKALRAGVESARTWLMEGWGERDNSFARFGTRFERAAQRRGCGDLIGTLNALSALDDQAVQRRMGAAPDAVRERHERSWRARKAIGEAVTEVQDARDVLRVFSYYELRDATALPLSEWLGVESDVASLQRKAPTFARLLGLLT